MDNIHSHDIKFYSKVSIEDGGGGNSLGAHTHGVYPTPTLKYYAGGSSSHTYTPTSLIYDATIVLSLDYKNKIAIIKDRKTEIVGPIKIETAVKKMAEMLCKVKFDGSMDMFQETMKQKLIEVITDVLLDKDIIPKGETKDDDTVQRQSGSDGVDHKSFI